MIALAQPFWRLKKEMFLPEILIRLTPAILTQSGFCGQKDQFSNTHFASGGANSKIHPHPLSLPPLTAVAFLTATALAKAC